MMAEVLTRRVKRAAEELLPDLIIVDGGLGQLGILTTVLEDLGISGVEVAALAKSRVRSAPSDREVTRSTERVFRPGRKNPIVLRQNSPQLLLLAQIRDEAHRFAITYHKQLRDRATLRSSLEDVPGIGPKLSRALLRHFGSIDKIRLATLSEITSIPGISTAAAQAVIDRLSSQP
jgi:excinuclease ABC subunit C